MSWIQVREQAKGAVYIACYIDENGKKVRKSTGIMVSGGHGLTARAALQLAEQTAARMEAAAKGTATLERLHDAIDVAAIEAGLKTGKTVKELLLSFEVGGNAENKKSRARTVQRFLDFLAGAADLRADKLTVEQCQAFVDLRIKDVSTRTVKKDVQFLSYPFSEAVKDGLLPRNPWIRVKYNPPYRVAEKVDRVPFTEEELKVITTQLPTEYADLAKISLYTLGQRLNDCRTLKWTMFDEDLTTLTLVTGKTGRRMVIPVCPAFRELLERRRGNGSQYVLPELAHLVKNTVSGRFTKLLQLHGVVQARDMVAMPGHAVSRKTFHSIRHYVVSKLRAAYMPGLVLEAVGQTEEVQQQYMHISAAQQLAMVDTVLTAI